MNETLLSSRWGPHALIAIELLLIGAVYALGRMTTLLRDPDPKQKDFRLRAYSLAKSQQAFWTVVVIGSFIYVYFSQGVCVEVLNNTALLLLGISTGTTALSAVTGKPGAPAQAANAAAGVQDHVPPSPHENFLDDILSDNEGINIHRLQMLIWTVVFGGIFIHQVVKSGKFPVFDDQAYVLMGISSVTYVWFKRTEK
jgi:hypothetical protein